MKSFSGNKVVLLLLLLVGKCHVRAVCATLYFPPELRSTEENAESHIHWTRNLHSKSSILAIY